MNKKEHKRRILYWVLAIGVGIASFTMGRVTVRSERESFLSVPKERYEITATREKSNTYMAPMILESQLFVKELQDKYLNTFDKTKDELVLVNKEHAIPNTYQVNLVKLEGRNCVISSIAADALQQMLADGEAQGLSFYITSSYRDEVKQQQLLEEDVATFMQQGMSYDGAYEETTRETMPAKHSEHESGLALDIVPKGTTKLVQDLEQTPEIQWLLQNCANYGFVLRYPKGKEAITNINYEPWHYRYVGVEAANYMTEHKITLEEFIELLP